MNQPDIPDDLAAALHAASDATPGHRGDLAAVQQRGRARRRHRTATAAGFAAVAAAVAIAVPSVLSGQGAAPETGPLPAAERTQSTGPAAAQRLLLNGDGYLEVMGDHPEVHLRPNPREAYEQYRDDPDVSGVLSVPAEVLPDGGVAELDFDLSEVDSVREWVPMPDGKLAAIGIVDRRPDAERNQDGICVEGLEFPLLVIEPDGSASTLGDLRVMCETVELLAADADNAYLVRDGAKLVAHDLATGEERVLLNSPAALNAEQWRGLAVPHDRLVSVANHDTCSPAVRVTDVSTGVTDEHALSEQVGCHGVAGPLRIAPDGQRAAVVLRETVEADIDEPQTASRVVVVDLTSGEVVLDQPVAEATDGGGRHRAEVAGIAWQDDQSLRVAWYERPENGLHWLADLLEVTTLSL